MIMTIEYIAKVLTQHSIPFQIENHRVYVDCMLAGTETFEQIVDVTDWTKSELYAWLGY